MDKDFGFFSLFAGIFVGLTGLVLSWIQIKKAFDDKKAAEDARKNPSIRIATDEETKLYGRPMPQRRKWQANVLASFVLMGIGTSLVGFHALQLSLRGMPTMEPPSKGPCDEFELRVQSWVIATDHTSATARADMCVFENPSLAASGRCELIVMPGSQFVLLAHGKGGELLECRAHCIRSRTGPLGCRPSEAYLQELEKNEAMGVHY